MTSTKGGDVHPPEERSAPPPVKRARLNGGDGHGEDEGDGDRKEEDRKDHCDAFQLSAPKAAAKTSSDAVDGPTSSLPTAEGKADVSILEPIAIPILASERVDELRKACETARPFPHGRIRGLCRKGFLEDVMHEVKQNSKVKFKESDLFRVYQSIDLGNLSGESPLARNMPNLMKLKAALYSVEYRNFVERIAGLEIGTLTEQVDCAVNCHAKGCHLLCHDDVICTRKVSYIVYLTDPEPLWADEDGGSLELYEAVAEEGGDDDGIVDDDDTSRHRFIPGPFPVKTILPEFNSLAYFVVRPGVSFHSVQEVFCDRPRLSIQGWYHAKEAPSQIENATLQRLKSTGKGEDTEGEFHRMRMDGDEGRGESNGGDSNLKDDAADDKVGDETIAPLSRKDRDFLGRYLNPIYLTDDSVNEIRARFEEESSVQLRHFLSEEWAAKIRESTEREDEELRMGKDRPPSDYDVGASDKWKPVGPAHKQRFLEYVAGTVDDDKKGGKASVEESNLLTTAGSRLHRLKRTLLESPAFGRWMGQLTSLGLPLGHRGRVRRFRPGLDYTVAHYGVLTKSAVLDATLCFCAGEGNQCSFDDETGDLVGSDDDALWESGDAGGFECYISADDGDEDAGPDAEYGEEDDTELLSVSASNNTLSLVFRDQGTMRFVKYLGIGAPSSRWDLALEYAVKSDELKDGDDIDS